MVFFALELWKEEFGTAQLTNCKIPGNDDDTGSTGKNKPEQRLIENFFTFHAQSVAKKKSNDSEENTRFLIN